MVCGRWDQLCDTQSTRPAIFRDDDLTRSRLRWRARDQVFKLVLATMMLPSVVTLIPQFILFAKLPAFGLQGSEVWVNTFLPLTVPALLPTRFTFCCGNLCAAFRWS
ncbi:MAG: hypothetical protein R2867_34025 [Caldilineaceae bacterium]